DLPTGTTRLRSRGSLKIEGRVSRKRRKDSQRPHYTSPNLQSVGYLSESAFSGRTPSATARRSKVESRISRHSLPTIGKREFESVLAGWCLSYQLDLRRRTGPVRGR